MKPICCLATVHVPVQGSEGHRHLNPSRGTYCLYSKPCNSAHRCCGAPSNPVLVWTERVTKPQTLAGARAAHCINPAAELTVAVVHVPVQDEHPPRASRLRRVRCDAGVVVEAEAHHHAALGVVPGRPAAAAQPTVRQSGVGGGGGGVDIDKRCGFTLCIP